MQQAMRPAADVSGRDHWTEVDGQRLFLWEKPALTEDVRGTVLFVHGSSMASTPTFDLRVDGVPEASAMDWFAARGFDAWCFDCRGYGRSHKEGVLATIAEGAADAAAASAYIMGRGSGPLNVYGISSGALRAALFAQSRPDMVRRLALDAMVWTGEGSPTLEQRRRKLEEWRGQTRRPIDRAFLMSIFNRDHPGTVDERFVDPFVEQVLALDDSVPNGTYIDMCANLPVADPEKIACPTLVIRGQYDGIAGIDDLLAFFKLLPNANKQFTVIPGIAHASFTQKNFLTVYDALYGFFARPEPAHLG